MFHFDYFVEFIKEFGTSNITELYICEMPQCILQTYYLENDTEENRELLKKYSNKFVKNIQYIEKEYPNAIFIELKRN